VYTRRLGAPFGGAAASLLVVLAFLTAAAAASAAPFVENARSVTGGFDPSRIFEAPSLAVDPQNPNTVALVTGNYHYPGGCYLYVSRNGGLSWNPPASLLAPGSQFCVDRPLSGRYAQPVFASDGSIYVGFGAAPGGQQFPNNQSSAYVSRSSDLGLTTSTSVVSATHMITGPGSGGSMGGGSMSSGKMMKMGPQSAMTQARGASITVDPINPKLVYLGWLLTTTEPADFKGSPGASYSVLGVEHSMVSVSHDGGLTWSAPVDLTTVAGHPALPAHYGTETPAMVAGPGGTVYAIADSNLPSTVTAANQLVMYKSTNNGASWKGSLIPFKLATQFEAIASPQAAIDPRTGEIYVTVNVQAGKPGTFVGAQSVYVMHSSNGGSSWSAPVNAVDPSARFSYDQYDPGISVAPDGRVDVAWMDYRTDPYYKLGPSGKPVAGSSAAERYYDIYAASSTDHGATWSKNVRVSDQTIDSSLGAEFPDFAVAPVGIASTNSRMYVAWGNPVAGAPPATPEDSFFTSVDFSAPGAVGTTAKASGDDVVWGIIGAGIALLLGGLILVGVRQRQLDAARPLPEKERVGSGAAD
jgi:hypothetical protein